MRGEFASQIADIILDRTYLILKCEMRENAEEIK